MEAAHKAAAQHARGRLASASVPKTPDILERA